ncbi:hypothetical protein D3C75_525950 [compost metagenome]
MSSVFFDKKQIEIEFHYFNPNIELCLRNDELRGRPQSAAVTIRNAVTEKPNINRLSIKYGVNVKLEIHEVETTSDFEINYKKFIKRHKLNDNKTFLSYSWSNGGNRCNCWGDNDRIDPDEEPELTLDYFYQFDQLMEEILPGMPLDLKNELLKSTVSINDDQGESDWYGGTEYRSAFSCNTERLFKILDERGIITMGILAGGGKTNK